MEGRIKPSPVLNTPPAKESDPFCTSATLLPLRPCRRNTFQKAEFPLRSQPPRARRNAASNRAFSFSQCAISARDLSSRARSEEHSLNSSHQIIPYPLFSFKKKPHTPTHL